MAALGSLAGVGGVEFDIGRKLIASTRDDKQYDGRNELFDYVASLKAKKAECT